MTPMMSLHARQRCEEMGISTKVAKRIVQHAEVTYPGTPGRDGSPTLVALWSGDRAYAVVMTADRSVVITVLFRTLEFYVRAGTTFIPCQGPDPIVLDLTDPADLRSSV